ncbi:11647_t:CDS:1 [Funneliformis mosseae]|uniref:11647_t:CDS:1 n=1 Tax=Funneliformis mosseae TaxID=27381 RepID=A0A9N9H8N0_FUNMO|nr:11647_t:CDS:1 [Funneliformis mosseae]
MSQIAPTAVQFLQLDELRLFYKPQDDDNFYHVTCKLILQDFISLDDNYEHGFFYQCAEANYYVTCKLFSNSLIIDILNKEIYGMDIDINLYGKGLMTLHQKFNLEQSLKQILPFYLLQQLQHPIIPDENGLSHNISYQDENGNKDDHQQNDIINAGK